ncbi:Glyoxylase, beta-lactamase superfamily II [Gracilibacillus orientalis]|uniref:Glyoxylase, beta-lactamase superfamily II n=1 Tax=Gracilibacillus orientalis TaxID=334253 RepID=A0A1I4KV83_9BACI|nr:MBL fold metallo-hydrolase [Gracilibacillus orientalis]SFL82317.1 Glyoxylase, beta-lactamase superfamily II [Gracilibacillus orientalis]
MRVEQMPLGPLATNCYIVSFEEQAIIIDPAGDGDKIINKVIEMEVQPLAVLLTHAHFDHIGALEHVRDHYQIPVYIHELESTWLEDPNLNGSSLFDVGQVKAKKADHFLHNKVYQFGSMSIEIRHTPGHSPGGVAFVFHDEQFVIGGDSLFAGAIGRTDLPGGSFEQLEESIREQFYTLPDEYIVYPGHGSETSVKKEKETNPFVQS